VIMVKHCHMTSIYAPIYIHSFCFPFLACFNGVEKFQESNPYPEKIESTSDKLRYFRYKKALFQRDIADYAGIDRSTYIHYEDGMDYYDPDKLAKVAELLEVNIQDLMDKYNMYIYNGQGNQIRAMRNVKNITQKELAKLLCVSINAVKRWENEKVRISKGTWKKLIAIR
jgi:transcriptional regulator with XRE-family HTH domain